MKVQIPGVAWSALITGLTAVLSSWLTNTVTEPWIPLVVVGLSTIAKLVQLYVEMQAAPVTRTMQVDPKPRFLTRVLLG